MEWMNPKVSMRIVLSTIGVLAGFAVVIFLYTINYGFSFPPCKKYEVLSKAPALMETSDIIFEKQRYYVISPDKYKEEQSFWDECKTVMSEAVGQIMSQDEGDTFLQDGGYQVIPIEKNTRFKLVRRTYVHANGINAIGGSWGDTYLLKNDEGKLWYIDPLYFKNLEWTARSKDKNESEWAASYYVGDKRISDVVVDR